MNSDATHQSRPEQLLRQALQSGALYTTLRTCHRRFRTVIDADDFAQRVLERLWRERETLRDQTEPGLLKWAKSVARNIGIDEYRSAVRARSMIQTVARLVFNPKEEVSAMEFSDLWTWIRSELLERECLILRMRYHQGLSPTQIATELKIPVQNVIQAHYRAIQKLRDKKSDFDHAL